MTSNSNEAKYTTTMLRNVPDTPQRRCRPGLTRAAIIRPMALTPKIRLNCVGESPYSEMNTLADPERKAKNPDCAVHRVWVQGMKRRPKKLRQLSDTVWNSTAFILHVTIQLCISGCDYT